MHSEYLSISDMAAELGLPPHRVRYAASSRGIEPTGTVGGVPFWTQEQFISIKSALSETARHRCRRSTPSVTAHQRTKQANAEGVRIG